MNAVQNLINEVSHKLKALETAQALYSRQLSPDFNTFDYINTDELGLSRILAALLNPKGSHAQQEIFLKLFIEHCLSTIHKAPEWQSFLNNIEKTKVLLEVVTEKINSSRRMDVYLNCQVGSDSYGICIENKPYATDQFEQLKDYAIELKKRHSKAWHLIYISESDYGPSEYSIKANELKVLTDENRFSAVKFSDLVGWLKACQVECQNHSVSEFIAQLIKFIQKQFMGIEDMSESNAVVEIIRKNSETIDASIKVSNTIDQMKRELIKKLKTDLLKKCEKTHYKLDISNLGKGKNYEQINFIIPNFDIGYICFEFQGANFDRPCLGIRFASEDLVKSSLNKEKIKTVLDIAFSDKKIWNTKLWPAGYNFQPQDWKGSSEAWLMINNDTMADKILEEMDKVYQVLNENSCFNH